jgi:hypothetical protein
MAAICPVVCKSGNPCKRKVQRFGVCMQHKDWAHDFTACPEILPHLQELIELARRQLDSYNKCKNRGVEPHSAWGINLCQIIDPNTVADTDLREFVASTEGSRALCTQLQTTFDPYLIYNLSTGITHCVSQSPATTPFLAICIGAVQPYIYV